MNLTKISDAPEVYKITESRNVRVNQPWKGTRASTITSECKVTRADGSTYTFVPARAGRTRSKQAELLKQLARIERQNKLDELRAHAIKSSDLPAIGNID